MDTRKIIASKFKNVGNYARIPLLREDQYFNAQMTSEGILVDNLSTQPLLPWIVFEETVQLLQRLGGSARKGDAMNNKLCDPGLSLNSVEGHIAHIVYNKQPGDWVFRRITPIACILIWAGICSSEPGVLILN